MENTNCRGATRTGVVGAGRGWAMALPFILALGTTVALCGGARAESSATAAPDSAAAAVVAAARDGQITDAIAQRLESKQLFELIRNAQNARAKEGNKWGEAIVPVGVVGIFFTSCVLAIFIPLYLAYRRGRRQQDIMMAMVEKGMQIPAHLVAPSPRSRNDLRTGIILLCTGAGICLAMLGIEDFIWQLGLVPLAIGVGYTVVGLLGGSSARGTAQGPQAVGGSDETRATSA